MLICCDYCFFIYSDTFMLRCSDVLFYLIYLWFVFCFFFKQNTAYDMRISDWSSDVCSSDFGVVGCLSMRGIIAGLRRSGALPSPCRRRGRGKGKSSRLKPLLHGRTQHHRGAAFGQEGAGVVDAEAILLAALGLEQHFRSEARRGGKECVST